MIEMFKGIEGLKERVNIKGKSKTFKKGYFLKNQIKPLE